MPPLGATRKRAIALLSKGYFPKELPPAFTTADFGRQCWAIVRDGKSAGVFSVQKAKAGSKISGSYHYNIIPSPLESDLTRGIPKAAMI